MDPIIAVVVLVLFVAVIATVGRPLLGDHAEAADERDSRDVAALEAAKDAKYAEIRELEMDFRTGKVEEADFKVTDRALRAEAVALLEQLDRYA